MISLTPPLSDLSFLKAGDEVEFSGTLYTARDRAHQKLVKLLDKGEELPIPLHGSVIYYVGPCPAKPGEVIGSAGPTTASRMDSFTLPLLDAGLKGMIGKGNRSPEVISTMIAHRAVYFAAVGGIGALLSTRIVSTTLVAYEELGPEAVYRLEVERFPCIVAIDSLGESIYKKGREQYQVGGY